MSAYPAILPAKHLVGSVKCIFSCFIETLFQEENIELSQRITISNKFIMMQSYLSSIYK